MSSIGCVIVDTHRHSWKLVRPSVQFDGQSRYGKYLMRESAARVKEREPAKGETVSECRPRRERARMYV